MRPGGGKAFPVTLARIVGRAGSQAGRGLRAAAQQFRTAVGASKTARDGAVRTRLQAESQSTRFTALAALLGQPGRVFGPDDLQAKVWLAASLNRLGVPGLSGWLGRCMPTYYSGIDNEANHASIRLSG